MSLTVDVDIDADQSLLGKYISDLQSGVTIEDGKIKGTLLYVTGYTGYSETTELQSGNYLALHASVPGVPGATIKVKLSREATLDSDGTVVARIENKDTQKITFTASILGYESVSKTYDLSNLTVNAE